MAMAALHMTLHTYILWYGWHVCLVSHSAAVERDRSPGFVIPHGSINPFFAPGLLCTGTREREIGTHDAWATGWSTRDGQELIEHDEHDEDEHEPIG